MGPVGANLPQRVGKYELLEFLGGGMSRVYRAVDTVLDRTVAIKILVEGFNDPESHARFLNEAKVAASLSHENIVNIYDFGEFEGRSYLVMEFLRGESLAKRMSSTQPLSLDQKLSIAMQVAMAINYVHSFGFVHRDIKPDNIHIDDKGRAKLMDFGIAKNRNLSITRAGFTIGTPYYMSPEQIKGEGGTFLSDVYSFGVVLYELFTGRKPFDAGSMQAVFYAVMGQPVDLAPLHAAALPDTLCSLILRCMEKSASDRIPSFAAILKELEAIIKLRDEDWTASHLPSESSPSVTQRLPLPTGPVVATPSRSVRRRWIVGLAIAAMAIVVTAFALSSSLVDDQFWRIAVLVIAVAAALIGTAIVLFRLPARTHPRDDGLVHERSAPESADAVLIEPERPATDVRPAQPEPPPSFAQPPSRAPESTAVFPTSAPGDSPSSPPATTQSPNHGPVPSRHGDLGESTRLMPVGSIDGEEAPISPTSFPAVALVVSSSSHLALIGRRFVVDSFPCTIGRSADADIDLSLDHAVTRQHATIEFEDGGFSIRDSGSSNGTFVNGKRLPGFEPQPLLFGAKILLGSNTELTFTASQMTEISDLTGRTIGERYLLTEKVVSGAKSAVYIAQDSKLPRSVLVKILSPSLVNFPGYREQFEREARTASELNHPHINRVLDFGEVAFGEGPANRSVYLCMEYLDGGSLAKRLIQDPPFPVEQVAGWIEKIASGLTHVHEAGIIHGGIRPSSIIFDGRDNPYLTDFALALSIGAKAGGTVIGAPAFLAPEQWESAEISSATDQYSLAALLYLVLTGVLPYEGQEHPKIRKRNFSLPPPAAHEIADRNGRPQFPAAVSKVLEQALAREPEMRFPAIADFAAAFLDAIDERKAKQNEKMRVFISYQRSASSPWALYFKKELEREHGFSVFVDSEQRDNAGQFPRRIEQSIMKCDVFVCILSQRTLDSAWVQREIEIAHQGRKPIVPVFQESFRMPRDLQSLPVPVRELLQFSGVKLFDRQNTYVDAAVKLLAETIRQSGTLS